MRDHAQMVNQALFNGLEALDLTSSGDIATVHAEYGARCRMMSSLSCTGYEGLIDDSSC